jgi:voltage-gated potassium channel Kch
MNKRHMHNLFILSLSIVKKNLLSFVNVYLILSSWIFGIIFSIQYFYVEFSRSIFILYLLLVFIMTCRFFAWFCNEVFESIQNSSYRFSILHLNSIQKKIFVLTKNNRTVYYLYLFEFWWIYFLVSLMNLIGSIFCLVVGIFTLFIPFAIYRSVFLILPHVCIAYANTTSNNTFNGYEMINLTFKISKKYFVFLYLTHIVFCNLFFGLFLLNRFIWKLDLLEMMSSFMHLFPWILSFFMIMYWLLTCVYAKHLISSFELEKSDIRT